MPVRRSERRRRLSLSRIADIHVWTIISDPRRDPQKLLMVNFTTWELISSLNHCAPKGASNSSIRWRPSYSAKFGAQHCSQLRFHSKTPTSSWTKNSLIEF
jgi:hypothetical protein